MGDLQFKCGQKPKNLQKKEKPKVYKIKWRDPEIVGSWHTEAEINAPMEPIFSIGYLVRHTEDTLVLAGTIAPNWDGAVKYGDVAKFPIGCILEIIELVE